VADDDMAHREMIREILTPLGFIVFDAPDGAACARLAAACKPDLVLLDVSMPGMSGWDVARLLRRTGERRTAIVMISANANEAHSGQMHHELYDEYLVKPIDVRMLLERIGQLLHVKWLYEPPTPVDALVRPILSAADVPSRGHIDDLRQLGQIGYVRGIQTKLDEIEREEPAHQIFVTEMRALVKNFELHQYMAALEALQGNDSSNEVA
jgi:CheY-like chemotaxis protein